MTLKTTLGQGSSIFMNYLLIELSDEDQIKFLECLKDTTIDKETRTLKHIGNSKRQSKRFLKRKHQTKSK